MKKLFLRFSLALALSFGVKAGIAQQEDVQDNGGKQAVEAVIEDPTVTEAITEKPAVASVVAKKRVMTEAEVKRTHDTQVKVVLAPVWFRFKSGAYNVAGNYEFLTDDDMEAITECATGTEEVCAIRVEPDGTGLLPDPTALTAIQTEISTALGSPGHTSNVRLKNL